MASQAQTQDRPEAVLKRSVGWVLTLLLAGGVQAQTVAHGFNGRALTAAKIDAVAERIRAEGQIPGLAIAIIDDGKVAYLGAYGLRDVEHKLPLKTDTVMYAASLTKAVFGYTVASLADEGKLNLDAAIADFAPKPTPDAVKFWSLAKDPRWKSITPRMVLTHSTGLANFTWLEPDGEMRLHFQPGTRFAYSGEGLNFLQFALEDGLHLDVAKEMQRRVFDRFGMQRSSMVWRDDFAANATTGYDETGKAEPHHHRGSVRAAGFLDTTIADYAAFLAGVVRGDGLSSRAEADMLAPSVPITSAHQFPTLTLPDDLANAKIHLAAGLGWVVFDGPYGHAFYKGGHDDFTDNHAECVVAQRRCILLMTNSGVGARLFKPLVTELMGDAGIAWDWEYNPVLPLKPAPAAAKPQ